MLLPWRTSRSSGSNLLSMEIPEALRRGACYYYNYTGYKVQRLEALTFCVVGFVYKDSDVAALCILLRILLLCTVEYLDWFVSNPHLCVQKRRFDLPFYTVRELHGQGARSINNTIDKNNSSNNQCSGGFLWPLRGPT